MGRHAKLFIISGPSGSGKTTLCQNLLKRKNLKNKLVKSISLTTRKPRRAEKSGKDYIFVSTKEFLKQRRQGELLESQRVLGCLYGTPQGFVEEMLKNNKSVILSIDIKGALVVKKFYPEAVSIFILPPSLEILKQRLKGRSTEARHQVTKRLRLAKKEIGFAKDYDYVVVNNKLDSALNKLEAIILAEISKN